MYSQEHFFSHSQLKLLPKPRYCKGISTRTPNPMLLHPCIKISQLNELPLAPASEASKTLNLQEDTMKIKAKDIADFSILSFECRISNRGENSKFQRKITSQDLKD